MSYAELEIGLSALDQPGQYQVELRFDNPKDDAERTPVRGVAAIDPQALLALADGPGNEYGLALAKSVFSEEEVRGKYGEFKAAVESTEDLLRVKLFVDRSAPELHRLRWELLADPATGQALATSERILFSRFGSSSDWRPIRLRAKRELRALVAVSSPSNLDQYGLAPVDVDGEVARAREHLDGIQVTVAGQDATAPLTLERLIDGLRRDLDVLYLVCHGGLHPEKGPLLYLQDEEGNVKVAGGDELAQRIGELVERPRLVVLASCESAGSEQVSTQTLVAAGQLVPLAPALAEAGVHAVLAMQGKIGMETVKAAMPVFFGELLKDGQIDRAMAVARGKVRQQPDSWMPALFLRLKGGKIWYEPGFGEGEDFAKWKALVGAVRRGSFTPIVGPGLGERVYGPLRDATRELAETTGFPLAEHQRSELQQVSQFLQFNQDVATAREMFKDELRQQILRRHDSLPPEAKSLSLSRLMALVGQSNREGDADDPYRLLAQLDAELFVTANPDNLLQEALKAEGKEPETFFFNWREKTQVGEPTAAGDRDPEPKHPLVFHIFGFFRDEDSLVLTEDDYFDYLISLIQYKPRIPAVVGHQTTSTSLLFLGFQLTDWNFRVLYRLIMSQEGSSRLKQLTHVAVQVDPEEEALINPRAARKYLEDYFGTSGPVNIFWGSAGEFLKELSRQLASVEDTVPVATVAAVDDW